MITHVEFLNGRNQKLSVPFGPSPSTPLGYRFTEIEGLGPVVAELAFSTFATMDGGVYEDARVPERTMLFKMGFVPDFTSDNDPYGTLRRQLYAWFAPKTFLTMTIFSDNHETVRTWGYVEDMIPVIFSRDPEVQISIECPDPYFSSLAPMTAEITGSGTTTVENPGDVPVGLTAIVNQFRSTQTNGYELTATALGSKTTNTILYRALANGTSNVAFLLNTVKGSKAASWIPATTFFPTATNFLGSVPNILGYFGGWVLLPPGSTVLKADLSRSATPTAISKFSYLPKFVGL